jgi:hypothetical protein
MRATQHANFAYRPARNELEVHACAGSDRHDPHGIEHKAEEKAIQGKFEHGALPQSDRLFGHLTTKTTGSYCYG